MGEGSPTPPRCGSDDEGVLVAGTAARVLCHSSSFPNEECNEEQPSLSPSSSVYQEKEQELGSHTHHLLSVESSCGMPSKLVEVSTMVGPLLDATFDVSLAPMLGCFRGRLFSQVKTLAFLPIFILFLKAKFNVILTESSFIIISVNERWQITEIKVSVIYFTTNLITFVFGFMIGVTLRNFLAS
jgi:hypothetical protein